MKRLTELNTDGEWVYIERNEETIFNFDGDFVETRPYFTTDSGKHVDKLAEYEDLGYSPEELKERLELAWMYEDLNK